MITRRHALSAIASAALVAPVAALAPPDPDAAIVALYERFTALARHLDSNHEGVTPQEEDRYCEAIYEEIERHRAALLSAKPSGPLGVACIALTQIRACDEAQDDLDFLLTWDGYSRPPANILSDHAAGPLWTIAEWGLRQSGRLPASA